MTPQRWLHLTVLIAGLADEVGTRQIGLMVSEATQLLRDMAPITVTIGRVLYHSEAVMVAARPAGTLVPLLKSVQAATRSAIGRDGILPHEPWTPHVTIAYSSKVQPAAPIIAALGRELPERMVTIRGVSLVNQDGPEYLWNWEPIVYVPLGRTSARSAAWRNIQDDTQ
jgi:2'-5' RNA ligase